jgi:hypothetical protein
MKRGPSPSCFHQARAPARASAREIAVSEEGEERVVDWSCVNRMAARDRATYAVRGFEHASEVDACVVNGAAIVLDKGHVIALACQQQTANGHQLG